MTTAALAHLAENDTLPKLVRYNALHHGGDLALREKELGLWRSQTWHDVNERVKLWALGLAHLGVSAGDTVAIISDCHGHATRAAITFRSGYLAATRST